VDELRPDADHRILPGVRYEALAGRRVSRAMARAMRFTGDAVAVGAAVRMPEQAVHGIARGWENG
jgi:hypothetical protein